MGSSLSSFDGDISLELRLDALMGVAKVACDSVNLMDVEEVCVVGVAVVVVLDGFGVFVGLGFTVIGVGLGSDSSADEEVKNFRLRIRKRFHHEESVESVDEGGFGE